MAAVPADPALGLIECMNAHRVDFDAFASGEWTTPSGDWIAEEKLDGNRAQLYVADDGAAHVVTRGEKDVTANLARLGPWPGLSGLVLDGELVAPGVNDCGCDGHSLYSVRSALGSRPEVGLEWQERHGQLRFVVFDALRFGTTNVTGEVLAQRHELLDHVWERVSCPTLDRVAAWRRPSTFRGFLRSVMDDGGEGIVLKDLNATYSPGKRTRAWLKVKRQETWDWVITGFTDANEVGVRGERAKFAGLIGAVEYGGYDSAGNLVTIGRCSGMNDVTRQDMTRRPAYYIGKVAEISGQDTTPGSFVIRHPNFLWLRNDKDPRDCRMDMV